MGRSKEGSRQARRAALARELGLRQGWQAGEEMGRRLARLEAVTGLITPPAVIRSDWRVLYVTSGMEEPYSSLDSAVIDALGGMVRELGVIAPSRETAAEAVRFEPDLVLVLSGIKLPVKQAALMRSLGLRTAVWFTDDPYYTDWTVRIAPPYRHVFTQDLGCVPFYRGLGCEDVRYLPLGMNPKTFHPRRSGARHHTDVCFIGNAFSNRIRLFQKLAPRLEGRRWLISGLWWRRMKGYGKYRDHLRTDGWLSPEETALYYSGARMVINQHRASDDKRINFNRRGVEALSVNPRTFEISGCGVLQLIDRRADLPSCYTPGLEIETYGSAEELGDKIQYYLKHEDEGNDIARRALIRTLQEHTYASRLQRLLEAVGGLSDESQP